MEIESGNKTFERLVKRASGSPEDAGVVIGNEMSSAIYHIANGLVLNGLLIGSTSHMIQKWRAMIEEDIKSRWKGGTSAENEEKQVS